MFEYVAKTYSIGNFDAPGVFATQGPNLYFRNYQLYDGTESFKMIGYQFVEDLKSGKKAPLSNKVYSQFLSVNLRNIEYFFNNPLKAVVVANAFLAFLIVPLLVVDFFVPISGRGPMQKKSPKKEKPNKTSPTKDYKDEVRVNKMKGKTLKFD